jgi:hypothetical protein
MISELTLERYCLGEISPTEQTAIEAAIASDKALAAQFAARIAELKQSDREIHDKYHALYRNVSFTARRRARTRRLAVGLCAAVLMLAVMVPVVRLFSRAEAPQMDRIKGGNELRVYLKTDTGEATLARDMKLREGNTIQLAYIVNTEQYGAIFSIDGWSVVTPHYPDAGQSARLTAGRQIPLNEAYTLDDAPLYEIFFFITSETPFNTEEILRSARILAQNPATAIERSASVFASYNVKTVLVEKE